MSFVKTSDQSVTCILCHLGKQKSLFAYKIE